MLAYLRKGETFAELAVAPYIAVVKHNQPGPAKRRCGHSSGHARPPGGRLPPELEFLVRLTHVDESQTLIQPAGIWVVLLDAEVEGDARRRSLRLEVLDDRGAYAAALETGKQLNAGQLDAASGAGYPHPADALVTHLDHADRRAGISAPDLLDRPLAEVRPPLPLVKAVRKAALSPRGLHDHIREEPGIFSGGGPHPVTEHESMLSPPAAGSLINFGVRQRTLEVGTDPRLLSPKAHRFPEVVADKLRRVHDRHVAPLNGLVEQINAGRDEHVAPWFDPDGGGTGARVLFLLENPGRTARRRRRAALACSALSQLACVAGTAAQIRGRRDAAASRGELRRECRRWRLVCAGCRDAGELRHARFWPGRRRACRLGARLSPAPVTPAVAGFGLWATLAEGR
jgi:hypothetical protein